MELGKFNLEYKWDAGKASVYYKKALDWFREIRKHKNVVDLFSVPEKVESVSAPRGALSSLSKWKSITLRKIDPKEIINQKNASYISENEKNCLFMVGFFLFMERNYKKAKECFLNVKTISKDIAMLESEQMPNLLMRLRGACDQGWFLTEPKHSQKFKTPYKLKLYLSELYWILEQYDDSERLSDEVINDGKAGDEERAYAQIIKARCWSSTGKSDKDTRIEKYYDVYKKYPRTLAAPMGIFFSGRLEDSRGNSEKAIQYYTKVYTKYKNTLVGQCSLANCVWSVDGKDAGAAWKFAQKYFELFPKGHYTEAIKKLISKKEYNKYRK